MNITRWLAPILFSVAPVCATAAETSLAITTPMVAPEWARLERQLLAENVPACREFAEKYYDARGYVRSSATDGNGGLGFREISSEACVGTAKVPTLRL